MHDPYLIHADANTSLFSGPSSTAQQVSLTSGMSNQETSTTTGDEFTVSLSFVETTTESDPRFGEPSMTMTSGTEPEGPPTTAGTFTVPLTSTATLTQTAVPPSQPTQPDATSTTDISTIDFRFPWETIIPPSPSPSTLITTASPSLIITAPTSDPSPTSSSSLSAGAIAGITIGVVLGTVLAGAALVFYLHRKNKRRVNDFEMHRVEGREDGERVDLSPGA